MKTFKLGNVFFKSYIWTNVPNIRPKYTSKFIMVKIITMANGKLAVLYSDADITVQRVIREPLDNTVKSSFVTCATQTTHVK